MAIADNFNLINFSTKFPIDKIGAEGEISYSQASTGADSTRTIPNPLGYKCLPTIAWSIDGINFYPADAKLNPLNPYTLNVKVSATTITFYLYNNSGGTVTFTIKYALDTIT